MFERSWTFAAVGGAQPSVYPIEINGPGGDDPLELLAMASGQAVQGQFIFVCEGDKDAATINMEIADAEAGLSPIDALLTVPLNAASYPVRVPSGTPRLTLWVLNANPLSVTVTVRSPR